MKKLAMIAAALVISTAHAEGPYKLSVGVFKGSTRISVSHQLKPLWAFTPELSASRWYGEGGTANQITFVPLLHYRFTDRLAVEGGIGFSYFSNTRFGREDITTKLQFADQLGISYTLSGQASMGLQAIHFSNAGLKKPNPGVDIVEAFYKVKF